MTNRAEKLLEQESRASKRKAFAPPYVWPDEVGVAYSSAADIPMKPIHVPPDDDPLMIAAREAFPAGAPSYLAMIVHRYREMYVGIPEADAVRAILAKYSSPNHAMRARQLKRRPLKGESK